MPPSNIKSQPQPKSTEEKMDNDHSYMGEETSKVSSKKPINKTSYEVQADNNGNFIKEEKIDRKRKYADGNNESDVEEVRINKYERERLDKVMDRHREFWKLRKVSAPTMTFMCKRCKDYNYRMGANCFQLDSGKTKKTERLWFKQSLCRGCVLWNMDMQDLQYRHADDAYPDYQIKKKN